MVYVIKYDGRKEEFQKSKIVRTCVRMGADEEAAKKVADRIEDEVKDGVKTKKIMKLIFKYIKKHKPEFKYITDLRDAIGILRPKPDFEIFIARLLEAYGYEVESNQMVLGRCVEHEIDAIGERGDETIYVEVKHHYKPHTYTGMGVFLESWATFEDLVEGNEEGDNEYKFNHALIISNTKLSDHARQYADCRGIGYIGWDAPKDEGLERMIEEKKLHPITYIKGLKKKEQEKLGDAHIVTIKELAEGDVGKISKKTRISRKRVKDLKSRSQKILSI